MKMAETKNDCGCGCMPLQQILLNQKGKKATKGKEEVKKPK
jgi:hypothetical protein